MGRNTHDLTEGSISKAILTFALPIFIGAFLQQSYHIVSSAIVGKYLGTESLAAVSVSNTMVTVVVIFVNGLTTGISTAVAQLFGAKRNKDLTDLVYSTTIPLSILAVVLSALFVIFSRIFLSQVLGAPEEVMDEALSYFRIYMSSLIFVLIYNVFSYSLRAMGNSKTPVYFLAFSSVLNAGLVILFIAVFHWGVRGAAVATFISQALSALLTMLYAIRKVPTLNIFSKECRFRKELLKISMKYGIPNAVQQLLLGTSSVFLSRFINSFGAITMAANGAVERITSFATQLEMSFSRASTSFTGQNVGAKRFDRVSKGLRVTLLCGGCLAIIITVICAVFSTQIIGFFIKSGEPGADQVLIQGKRLLGVVSLGYVFVAANFILSGLLRGSGDVAFTSYGTVIMVISRIFLAYSLAEFAGTGYVSISISLVLMNFMGTVVMLLRYKSGKWKKKSLSEIETELSAD